MWPWSRAKKRAKDVLERTDQTLADTRDAVFRLRMTAKELEAIVIEVTPHDNGNATPR